MKTRVWLKPLPILRLALSLLIAGQAFPARELMAAATTPVNVQIRVAAPYADLPTAVTAVNAAPDFSIPEKAGGVSLSWAAPAAGDGSGVFSYVVRYATFPVSGLGDAERTMWWNHPKTLTALENGTPSVWGRLAHKAPGETETMSISGLTTGAYYYFAVRARDRYFRLADYDDNIKGGATAQSQTYAATNPWTPAKVTSLAAQTIAELGAIKLSWTIPQFFDENSNLQNGAILYPGEYCVQYSTVQPQGSVNRPQYSNNWDSSTRLFISTANVKTYDLQPFKITGLMLPTTYYIISFVRNEWPDHWSGVPNYITAQPFNSLKPVTGLGAAAFASPALSTGSYITLNWTNPTGENNIRGVRICYSTATTPATPESAHIIPDLEPETSGQARLYQHIQLMPRTTYYYTVYTYDSNGFYSIGVSTRCYTDKDLVAPDPVSNVSVSANVDAIGPVDRYYVNLNWTTPPVTPYYRNADYAGVRIYYSTYTAVAAEQQYLTTVNGANSTAQALTHDNLAVLTTYYYTMFTFDAASAPNVSTNPVTAQVYLSEALITPSKPTVLSMVVDANIDPEIGSNIYLRWQVPAEMNIAGTRLIFRTDRFPAGAQDGTVWTDKNASPSSIHDYKAIQLTPSATYYMALFAYSSAGTYSRIVTMSAFTAIPWGDTKAPLFPLGIKVIKNSAHKINLSWAPVRYNVDRTKFQSPDKPGITDLFNYEVFRSTYMFGGWSKVGNCAYSITHFNDTLPFEGLFYYKVRSRDASGNYSDSYIVDTNGYVHVLCDDGSSLSLSQAKAQNNMLITIARDVADEKGPIIKAVEWESYIIVETTSSFILQRAGNYTSYFDVAASSGSELSGLSVSYTNGIANGSRNAPALMAMTEAEIERMVSLFYFNGVEWLKLGSTVDKEKKLVTAKAKFTGRYQLRKSAPATQFTFYGVMPKIITPNNDGQNDRALFRYANPKANNVSIKIFDLNGALVKDLNDTNLTSDVHGEYIYWDATNTSGETVSVGVYIYQLEGEGKVVNGTIVVAR